jgi:hypothetical protein
MIRENKPEQSDKTGAKDDAISISLYAAGLAVSILGILAVNSALSETPLGQTAIVLTILGFVFSIGCRWLQIKTKIVEVFMLFICLFFAYKFFTNSIELGFFVPPDVSQPDLLIAVALVWLTVIRSWILTNDDSVMFTAVTSVAMIGLVSAYNLNTEMLIYFFIYTICATFLLLHQTYLTQRSWSKISTRNISETKDVKLQVGLALMSGVVALLLATVLVVPLRAVGAHLSLASALKNFIDAPHAGKPGDSGPGVSLTDEATFKVGTGNGYSASDQVVLHVFPSDHQEHYYRGRTYDTYEGYGWSGSDQGNMAQLISSPDTAPSSPISSKYILQGPGQPGGDASNFGLLNTNPQLVTYHFVLASAYTQMLYLPYGTTAIGFTDGEQSEVAQAGDNRVSMDNDASNGFEYWAYSEDTLVNDPAKLRTAPSAVKGCPSWMRREYIDQTGTDFLGSGDADRLLTTARSIVDQLPINHRTDYDKAEAIRQWVSARCKYSLDVGAVPTGEDAVSYFLFDSRRGYCDLFASSMAVLCRYAGLPSRVATGFDSGTRTDNGSFDLKVRDKHAWVEVWFKGYGWQVFDPTEGSVSDTSTPTTGLNSGWLLSALAKIRVFLEINGELPMFIGLCIVLALLYVFKVEVFDKRFRKRPAAGKRGYASLAAAKQASPEAAALYSKNLIGNRYYEFEHIIAKAGLKRLPHQTPAEFMQAIESCLQTSEPALSADQAEEINKAIQELTVEVMTASYAPIEVVGEMLVTMEEGGAGERALAVVRGRAGDIRRALKRRGVTRSYVN